MEELGYTKEQIEGFKKEAQDIREHIFNTRSADVTDQVSDQTRGYFAWLIEKSHDVLTCINKGGSLPMAAVHIGILHQELINTLLPLIRKSDSK